MTTLRGWRRVAAVLSVLLVAPLTVLATAGPSAADGDGSISGVVTGTGGTGLAGIRVLPIYWDGAAWHDLAATYTGADGSYTMTNLAPGSYVLGFDDPTNRVYRPQVWPNATGWSGGAAVGVADGEHVTGLDIGLTEGGRIAGTVSGPGPLASIAVTAYASDGFFLDLEHWFDSTTVYTDAAGRYEIPGLPSGQYTLCFQDATGAYILDCLGHTMDREDADTFAVTVGQTATQDFLLGPAGHITGTVTNPAGNPVPGVWVMAFVENETGDGWVGSWEDVTDQNGRYRLGHLRTGTYRVEFTAPWTADYADQYYPGAVSLEEGSDIAVVEGATTANIDARLGPAPGIPNTAAPTITGTPRVGASLTATPGTWTGTGVSFTYQWLADGAPIGSATGPTYVPVAGDIGKTVSVRVTASRHRYSDTSALSAATGPVRAAAIINVASPSIVGSPDVGEAVTATTGVWDPADADVSLEWLVDGTPVATTATYTPAPGDAGKTLSVRVTATQSGLAQAVATSAGKTVRPGRFAETKEPRVTGRPRIGETLVLDTGAWLPSPMSVEVQWYADGAPIARRTGTTLELTDRLARRLDGQRITVRLTLTAPGYRAETVTVRVPGKVRS